MPYDPIKSFDPFGVVGRTGLALLANADVPVKIVQEFMAYTKTREDEPPPYGSFGSGSSACFMAQALIPAANLKMDAHLV